tara:strand:+ start:112013 stop:113500 length:1488 start_codon:yes stop_codon:yes gene_type:complete
MTRVPRLHALKDVAAGVQLPGYAPQTHGAGIVHLGIGAFHRAHQAVYTDDALADGGGDWRIIGVSLRRTDVADALNAQNGLYTLLERSEAGTHARIIASVARVIAATRDRAGVMKALTDPATRIVSLTVTEKAYGIQRDTGRVDLAHPAISHDLADPQNPIGVIGFLCEGLRLRRAEGLPPFTVLCCDNLPENGKMVRACVVDFAKRVDTDLGDWIASQVAFPSTMVDRITPASTEKTLLDVARMVGAEDQAAIETEPFIQWVIEDHFPQGRPAWEAGGAIFVDDVAPYEQMKLSMLNGAHSMIAYAGFLAGCTYVRDAMGNSGLSQLVARHLSAAAATLEPLSGIDLGAYGQALEARFCNPEIAHETYQIAMDGTEKLPQRLLEPALKALHNGQDLRPFAFAVAAWMRYCLGKREDGTEYALRDPREARIAAALAEATTDAGSISDALHGLSDVFPAELRDHVPWREMVEAILSVILEGGMQSAIDLEARQFQR